MGLPGTRGGFLIAALAACYSPSAAPGVPCSPSLDCPSNQTCDVDAPGGPTCIAGPSSTIDAGNGSADGSMTIMTTNDSPDTPLDVSDGGAFPFDLADAKDDTSIACAGSGGGDLFYRITLDAPEVYYVETFGSSANVAVAIRTGPCTEPGTAIGCVDDSCGGSQVQAAWNLPAGEHCLVVENAGAGATTGKLLVVRGKRAGDPLPGPSGSVTGNTCNDDNSNNANCGCEPANDHHYFFTVCPNASVSAHLETCMGANWDTVLQIRSNANMSLGCTDDSCADLQSTLTRTVAGPGLFWAIIDGCDECGVYTLVYSF